jgi:hypothetical protein
MQPGITMNEAIDSDLNPSSSRSVSEIIDPFPIDLCLLNDHG